MKNRKPHVIALRTAAVLLILVMLSTSMVAGRYARYTTSASGSDSARVAKFLVTESGELCTTFHIKIAPEKTADIPVTVTNGSEVAIEYTIQAVNEHNNLPLTFALLDDATAGTTAQLGPGKSKDLKLQVGWETGETDDRYIGMVDLIQLTVTVTQID